MRKFILLTCLSLSIAIIAQDGTKEFHKSKVIGTVVDENGVGIPFASIALYSIRNEDTTLRKGTASDENGQFSLQVRKGAKINLRISFLSYEPIWKFNIAVDQDLLDIGSITLQDNKTLEEIVVEGEKSYSELKLDKRVFNVGKDITNNGANGSEILESVPSVEVDMEGNVSLRGSENVRILIDGKPSALLSGNLADALKQIPGENIERIEVITNPSARYDAEGEVGIINIVMKKNKKKGYSAILNTSVGTPDNYKLGSNLNWTKKHYSIYSNIALGYNKGPGGGFSNQFYTFEDTSYRFTRDRKHERQSVYGSFNFGSEINVNKKDVMQLSATLVQSMNNNITTNDYIDYDEGDLLTSSETRIENEEGKGNQLDITLAYYKGFNKKGREWNTTFKRIYGSSDETGLIEETVNDVIQLDDQRTLSFSDDKWWFIQSDFVSPVKENGTFETGVKGTYRVLDNNFDVEQMSNSEWLTLAQYDNHLIYKENISAAYMMYGSQWKKFSYQLGLRGEYSDVSTDLLQTQEYNPRQYFNLFPSTHFSYEMPNERFIQWSYSKRISRPRHWWLNPFYGLSDDRNYFTGNPNLDPELSHAFELSYLKRKNRNSLMLSSYYRYTTNVFQRVILVDSLGNTISQPHNIGIENSYGLEMNAQLGLYKSWSSSVNYNFYRSIVEGSYQDIVLNNDALNHRVKLNLRGKLSKVYKVQTSIIYRSPRLTPQGRQLAMYFMNVGASREILKKKATISLSVRDVFNTRKRRNVTEGDFYYLENEFQWRARTIMFNFSYRINQQYNKKKRRATRNKNMNQGGSNMEMDMM